MITPNLERVEAFFLENFEQRGDLGASLSIWHEGKEVLSLGSGFIDRKKEQPWSVKTPVLVWSATKGPSAASVLHALERQGESLETPVAAFWPEFSAHGKGAVTAGDLLAHRVGLAALDAKASVLDPEAVDRALAQQAPNWPLQAGAGAHGYHPRTFGCLLDALMRRLEGVSVGEYWAKWFAQPLGLDFWIGLPEERLSQVAPVYPARAGSRELSEEDVPFYKALAQPESLTARAFSSPAGLHGVASMNTAEARMAQLPGFGGIGTAQALAKFYAILAEGGTLEGIRFFSSTEPMERVRSWGDDQILLRKTAFAAGFMRDPVEEWASEQPRKLRRIFGPSLRAFGQPGAGGSHAFADPENRISFAYVMNQMDMSVLPTEKALGLVRALYNEEA